MNACFGRKSSLHWWALYAHYPAHSRSSPNARYRPKRAPVAAPAKNHEGRSPDAPGATVSFAYRQIDTQAMDYAAMRLRLSVSWLDGGVLGRNLVRF